VVARSPSLDTHDEELRIGFTKRMAPPGRKGKGSTVPVWSTGWSAMRYFPEQVGHQGAFGEFEVAER
jgi:hypothetical protein